MKLKIFLVCVFLFYSCASVSSKKSDSDLKDELRMKVECNYCNPTSDELLQYYYNVNKKVGKIPDQNKSFGVLQSDQNGWGHCLAYTSSSKGNYYGMNIPNNPNFPGAHPWRGYRR